MPASTSTYKKPTSPRNRSWTNLDLNAVVSVLLIAAATGALLVSMARGMAVKPVGGEGDGLGTRMEYRAVTGFFLQDEEGTESGGFDAMKRNFGLVDQEYDTDVSLPHGGKAYTQWERFAHKLAAMNEEASSTVSYRLLYLGRHGQGFHNVGEEFYGTEAWNCYYSTLDTDTKAPSVVFSDAHLTKLGSAQAKAVSEFWHDLLTVQRTPAPQSYYVSPLSRAIQTSNITFSPLKPLLPSSAPYHPVVKELLREGHGIHTCDRRPSKTYLRKTYDNIVFLDQDTFPEEDDLYSPTLREPPPAHVARMTLLLDDIFNTDPSMYISMTSHSGTIAATLRAIGHRSFSLPTGGAIPVLVQAEIVKGRREPFNLYDKTGWEGKPDCEDDPAKAGKKGFRDIGEYVKYIEDGVGS